MSAPLEGRPLDRPPVLHEVSFDVLDVERSIAAGAFEDGSQVPDIGTVYLREKDFSDVTLVLEEFHIWPEEIKLAFRLCYPPSWTDEECAAIAVDTGMLIYLDGYRPNERDIYNYASPFDCMGTYAGAMILSSDSYYRPPDDTYRDIMFANWKSTLTIEKWRNLESYTYIYSYYQRRLRANARPIPEEGYPLQRRCGLVQRRSDPRRAGADHRDHGRPVHRRILTRRKGKRCCRLTESNRFQRHFGTMRRFQKLVNWF